MQSALTFSLRRQAFEPFAVRDFRLLWFSNFLWHGARWMENVVLGWLVLEMTNSPWQVAVVGFFRQAPLLVLGMFAGVIVDRMNRKTLVYLTQALNLVTIAAVTLLLWTNLMQLWHLWVAAVLLGMGWSLDWPNRRTYMMDVVGREHLQNAMVLDTAGMNISKIIGPFLAGFFIVLIGSAGAFMVMTALYLIGFALIVPLAPIVGGASVRHEPVWRTLMHGLRHVLSNQAVVGVLLVTMFMNFCIFPYMQMLSVFARDVLFVGPQELGLLGAGDGLGSLLGIIAFILVGRTGSRGWLFIVGSVAMSVLLVGFAFSSWFWLFFALLALSGLAHTGFSCMQSTIILDAADEAVRGRAMGALTLAIGMAPLGTLLMGAVANAYGAPVAVGALAACCGVAVAATSVFAPRLRRT